MPIYLKTPIMLYYFPISFKCFIFLFLLLVHIIKLYLILHVFKYHINDIIVYMYISILPFFPKSYANLFSVYFSVLILLTFHLGSFIFTIIALVHSHTVMKKYPRPDNL